MELLQLKYFKTVAETGKISEAARALFISAPALSTSISRLETELEMPLFERTNNRIILNRQGQILLRYVNQMFSDMECAKAEMQQSAMKKGQHVAFACVGSVQWVNMVTSFCQAYPAFNLHSTSVRRPDIANGGLSAQYSFLLAAEDDVPEFYIDKLDSVFLFEEHPMVMVSPEHPLAKKESVDLKELLKERLFLPMQDFSLYDTLVQLFETCGLPLPAGNAYSHLTTQQLVAKGLGVAFATSQYAVTPGIALRYIPISNEYRPWVYRLYWRKNRIFTEDERIFHDFVTSFYKEL